MEQSFCVRTDISQVSKDANTILTDIIKLNYPTVLIKSGKGQTLAEFPEPYCMIFEFYTTMKFGNFKEAKSEIKVMTLSSEYSEEQCQFFVQIVPRLFTGELRLVGQELVWLIKFFDEFMVIQDLADSCFSKIHIDDSDKLKLLNYIVFEVAGKIPGPNMSKLLNMVLDGICLESIQNDIGPALFTFSFGRNILTKLLKSQSYVCTDETALFNSLVQKIKQINDNEKEKKISIKAFYDILACIRWFFVSEKSITDTLVLVKTIYPDFKVTKMMKAGFQRRAHLVSGYSEVKDTFKYDSKLMNDFLGARDSYKYSQSIRPIQHKILTFYSTTKDPFVIKLSVTTKTKKRTEEKFMVISSNIANLLIYIDITNKNGQLVIEKKWNFSKGKPLCVPVDNFRSKCIITMKMAYVPPQNII